MKPKLQKNTLLAICCADLMLLAACGGGGGGNGGMVRSDPPIPVQTTPPPPPPPLCSPTSDCIVVVPSSTRENLPAVESAYALILRSPGGELGLVADSYRFDGGTRIEQGWLGVGIGRNISSSLTTLRSNVSVSAAAALSVYGTVDGDVVNDGSMELWGTVTGDLTNNGTLQLSSGYDSAHVRRVRGDFRQSSPGTLSLDLAPAGWDFYAAMLVTGRADLGGTLQLNRYSDAWGPYPLPAAPSSAHVLHADGGVFGQFAQWTSPGMFVEGSVRYGSHDVWFDLTRISVQSAMAANAAGDPATLATAANVDAALSRADGFALAPGASLTAVQRRFLASAASLLYARDVAQASRTLDSLSGHAHAMAQDALHAQAATAAAQLDARLQLIRRGTQGGAWASPLRAEGGLGSPYSTDGRASGYDLWLAPQWLVGSSLSRNQGRMQLERMGGDALGESPMASIYAHYRGTRWHATGLVGAGRTTLQLDRPIDLGAAGMHVAHSRRELGQAFVHGELGRRVLLGKGQLTPFVAVDYSALHSDGFSEQGDTGFELVAQPGRSNQLSAAAGTRYTRDWIFGGNGWLQLNLDARYQRRLHDGGDAQQAAFLGVPEAMFDLTSWPQADYDTTLELGLLGGFGERWTWSADYARRFGIGPGNGGWFLGLRRDF